MGRKKKEHPIVQKKRGYPNSKIDKVVLADMLAKGITQADCAKHFNCSAAAVAKAAQSLKSAVNKTTALEIAPKIIEHDINVMDEHKKNYKRLESLLTDAEGENDDQLRLKTITEMRKHLDFSKELLKTAVDLNEVRAFQRAIIEVIGECSEPLKREIIRKLQSRRLLRKNLGMGGK